MWRHLHSTLSVGDVHQEVRRYEQDAYLEEFEIRTPTLLGPGIQTEVIFLLSR